MRFVLAVILITACGLSPAVLAGPVHLVVFVEERPARDVSLRVDGEGAYAVDADGALSLDLAAGRYRLEWRREDTVLAERNLVVPEGRSIQMIVVLPSGPDGVARFDVEGEPDAVAETGARPADRPRVSVTGRVTSADDGRPVAGAQLYFAGVGGDVRTDDDGRYQVNMPADEYQVSVVHPDFASRTLDAVAVTPEGDNRHDIELTPAGLELAEYTVSAPYVEGSVASVFSAQREASGVSEVLGAEQMSRAGDSDAADALRRVTGLTIEEGKFVVVRGQPARYTQTLWNGSPLPSPDPIRRIVPLDLFPTGVLSSIQVEKSYDAAGPGDFGGGLIRLQTAGVPDEHFFSLSAKVGGNSETTGKDGLDYRGGDSDALGWDDGTRELPPGLVGAANQNERDQAGQGFTNIWGLEETTMGPDVGFGLAMGRRGRLWGGDIGFRASLDWSNSYQNTDTLKRDYALRGDGSLALRNDQVERRSDMNVDLGSLIVLAAEWEKHQFTSNSFIIRKTVKRSEVTEGTRVVSDDLFIRDHLLDWNERQLFAQQFLGSHQFAWLDVDWRGMVAESDRYAPDRRDYIYRQRSDGQFVFYTQNGARRRFTESNDSINSFDLDLSRSFQPSDSLSLTLRGGFSTYGQDRESQVRRYRFDLLPGADGTADPNELLDPSGLGDSLELSDDTQTNDNYLGTTSVNGIYLATDLRWRESLRTTLGLRRENAEMEVRTFRSGGSQGGQEIRGGFEQSELLPTVSTTWEFVEGMQLRASFNRTVSRPVLNELSPARYYDPDTGDEYLGNPELRPAVIDAMDLRWEWYPTGEESFSVGAFSKDYTDPIEQSFVGVGGSSFLRQVQNAKGATVSGIELSARSGLVRLLPFDWAANAYIQANASFIDSEVTLARQDLATSGTRPLQGQADTVYNLQLGYEGDRHDAVLSFNRVGERLQVAGVQGQPDVYLRPIDQLDFTYSYKPGEHWSFKLGLENLLDSESESYQGSEIYRSSRKGRKFGLSLSYSY